jgi:hypothetical protein
MAQFKETSTGQTSFGAPQNNKILLTKVSQSFRLLAGDGTISAGSLASHLLEPYELINQPMDSGIMT